MVRPVGYGMRHTQNHEQNLWSACLTRPTTGAKMRIADSTCVIPAGFRPGGGDGYRKGFRYSAVNGQVRIMLNTCIFLDGDHSMRGWLSKLRRATLRIWRGTPL